MIPPCWTPIPTLKQSDVLPAHLMQLSALWCKLLITLGFFTNGIPAMKNPDALRILFPEFVGGQYKPLKKHNSRRIIS